MKKVLFLMFFLIPVGLMAQTLNVTGKVVDSSEEPIPGASIVVEGTNQGTVSDTEGNYRLENVPEDANLVFSFVGMETQTVEVNGRTTINVTIEESEVELDEVVAIGYQSVRKSDLTGATSIVDTEETMKTMGNSITDNLQGLASGVTVRNNGNPGNGPNLEIRGVGSFLNSNPLYVIDGMVSGVGPNVSPKNIESIQILKDASAAAIYGSRAANGVVIITTKDGKEGDTQVELSAKYGIAQMPPTYEMMDAYEYAATVRQQYENSGMTPPASVVGEDGTAEGFEPEYNTNWKDAVSRTGSQKDLNLTISGGSKNGNYLISSSYYEHEGVIIGNSFDRMSFRVNTSAKVGRFEFGEKLLINYARREHPNQGNAFFDMHGMLPVIPVKSDDYITDENPWGWGIGSEEAPCYYWNIPAVNFINPQKSSTAKAVGNAYVKFNIFDWLHYKFNAGMEGTFGNNRTMLKHGIWRYTLGRGETNLSESRNQFTSLLFDHTLNFDKNIGNHNFNGVVGISTQETEGRHITASKTQLQRFGDEYLDEVNSATGEPSADGATGIHYRTHGYLGRLNYNYDDRYQLTFTGRYDQDSRFAEEYRSGFFPSAAAAWRISNESFFDVPAISSLKLRGSYGKLGIVTVDSWDYIPILNFNQRAIFGPNQQPYVGANSPQLTNTDLRWEKRLKQNYGFDLALWNNKMIINAEYYNSESEDALLNQILGDYLGNLGGNPPVNAGGIRNSGVEASLTLKGGSGDFNWKLSGNFTSINNEVVSVGDQGVTDEGEEIDYIQSGISRSQVGRSIGEWYLIPTDGLFQSEEEVSNHINSEGEVIQPHAKPGDVRFVDINDDGTINQEDRDFVGSPWPDLQTGLQFNGTYRNFGLSVQMLGIFGNTIYNEVKRRIDSYHDSNFRADLDPWSPDNPDGTDYRLGVLEGDVALDENNRRDSERWLENGSYVRMRNVELSYTVPEHITTRAGMQNVRLFANAQNLFTITNYSGADPDVTGSGTHTRGEDNGNWPVDKIYSFGVQVKF